MTIVPRQRMSVDEFLVWSAQQPQGRFELVDGRVVAMSPERVSHTRAKYAVWSAFTGVLRSKADQPCEVLGDGIGVRVDAMTLYEPDCLIRCGERLVGDAIETSDPVAIVEVVSPSSLAVDTGSKLGDYFRLTSLRHYLIIKLERRAVIVHTRTQDGQIHTRVLHAGPLTLDPPGITVDVESLFPDQL